MECVKTGFHAHLAYSGEWIYGDAYLVGDVYIFRVCDRSFAGPIRPVVHFTLSSYDRWFDEGGEGPAKNSTLIVRGFHVQDHGYDGVPV